jgi:eukaryotic-like serine/threonine-protein kinase
VPQLASKNTEPIAGYTILERIGAGGYGEVWKAEAPGGLTKAIKFVYGYLDDERAARELKALNRIKEVRHPFLLSLERIEVVDGQLVIVTELAEKSLKDCYEEHRDSGKAGIPRDELLVYLADAADALDYMRENYSLQHLDVKPENLLIVGGRVKVADFGLVKDIHETAASMMGGLTPTYAPPEAFDGRPSLQSDQYSLAIVYQEMLTGSLPFPGTTTTQLAIQHLNSRPRLHSLPEFDRRAIARSLEKSPEDRFESCRRVIDALAEAGTAEQSKQNPSAESDHGEASAESTAVAPQPTEPAEEPKPSSSASPTVMRTQAFGFGQLPSARSNVARASQLDDSEESPEMTVLAPVDIVPEEARLRPTLFLGIGGTAGSIFRRLRRRLNHRFGSLEAVPAIEMLLLDTDRKAITAATQGDEAEVLRHHEALAMPLRRPQDYREESDALLKWLSRRWLYNIPRSLETEGRRPLGRLAFVDHSRDVMQSLRSLIGSITSKEALTASREETGMEFRAEVPRIFVVTSISGGSGSGMVLDIAYAVRTLLAELGLSDKGLTGLLCHCTSPNPAERDLAIANAYACLTELQHYGATSRFPGDPACNLPAAGDVPTFYDTYLVHLGNELDDKQFERATDDVAEYLYLNTATMAGSLFDKCREKEDRLAEPRSAGVKLRTFGLYQFGYSHGIIPTAAAEILSREVILRWSGQSGENAPGNDNRGKVVEALGEEGQADQEPDNRAERLELTLEQVQQEVGTIIEQELGVDAQTYFASLVQQMFSSRKNRAPEKIMASIDEVLGPRTPSEDTGDLPPSRLPALLDRQLRQLAPKRGRVVEQWLLELVDSPKARVAEAQSAVEWLIEHISSVEEKTAESREGVSREINEAEQELFGEGESRQSKPRGKFGFGRQPKQTPETQQPWTDYCRLRVSETILGGACKFFQLLRAQIAAAGDRMKDIQQSLGMLAKDFKTDKAWTDISTGRSNEPSASEELNALLVRVLKRSVPRLAMQLEAKLHEEFMPAHGGLHAVLERTANLDRPLTATLREAARKAILDTLTVVDVVDPLLGSDGSSRESRRLRDCITAATPRLPACGGGKRILLVLPEGSDASAIQSDLEENCDETSSVVFDRDGDIVLCHEVETISLARVAAALADNRPDYADAASRLHTRADIRWTSLGKRG